VADNTAFFNRTFSTRDAFKNGQSPLRIFVGADVNEIGSRVAVLGNKHWIARRFQVGDDFSSPTFQGGNKFSPHRVILKYHSTRCNIQQAGAMDLGGYGFNSRGDGVFTRIQLLLGDVWFSDFLRKIGEEVLRI
jgi:hypothetical protein